MRPLRGAPLAGALALLFACSPREGQAPHEGRTDPPTARRDLLEDLRASAAAPRHSSDGAGRAWIEDPGSAGAAVGRRGSWTIVYEAGPEGVRVGGAVRLTVSPYWNWSPPQRTSPDLPGFVSVACSAEDVVLRLSVPAWVEARVEGRDLRAGEQVRFVYGGGPAGAYPDGYAETGSRFWISVDGDGDRIASFLPDSPAVDVAPGPSAQLHLSVPSTAEVGERVTLRVAVLDRAGNAGIPYEGEVVLDAVPEGLELPRQVRFVAADGGVKAVEVEARASGVFRLAGSAAVEAGAADVVVGECNPLLVAERNARILWADLHGHSNLSDGTGTPEEYLRYARDVAGLDVVALTDHDHWGILPLDQHPEMWDEIKRQTERFHEPGRFVTVLGYEWTNWVHGHRHVLYFGDDGPVLSSIDPRFETPAQLWEGLRGLPALTFAHHSAGGPIATNWDFAPDPELEPVTEVASVHGSSEAVDSPRLIYSPLPGNFVRDALDRGYRLGFIGSGDSHDGHPGLAHLASPTGGVAALLTDDLSREGVRAALAARRCYATNGPRIVLRCSIGEHGMGSTIVARELEKTERMYVRAIACAPLETIDVVRSGRVVERIDCEERWDASTTVELEGLSAGEYVYVRVVQLDGGAAWSSPFYFE